MSIQFLSRGGMPELRRTALVIALSLTLLGCTTTGPTFVKPTAPAPADWSSWRSDDDALRIVSAQSTTALPERWWESFDDPVLNQLEREAVDVSLDLRTAALRFAQARLQRGNTATQGGPELHLTAAATRQRQSEYGASARMLDVMGATGANRDRLADLLAQPFSLYQSGFDASWEPDLWGRVRRAVEAADADVANQAALLELARLSLASELARHYVELRSTQRQLGLIREDEAALQARLDIMEARVRMGVLDHFDLERQRIELAALKAQIPPLLAQEAASANQLTLLLGKQPGELRTLLTADAAQTARAWPALPDLSLGLPSEVALRRPDIRSAEEQLHRTTASIGVAQAELYPSIRLGAKFGFESYLSGEFADWGSRTWSIAPTLDLPLFDRGRRQRVVQLRELQQQEAAIAYQRTVLQAWQEIDDALNGYAAQQQQSRELAQRVRSAREAYQLAQARYDGGATDFVSVIDVQRVYLQARRDLASSDGKLWVRYVAVNKALGNAPAIRMDEERDQRGISPSASPP